MIDFLELLAQGRRRSVADGVSEWVALNRVLLERLSPFVDEMPPVLSEAMGTARRYWFDGVGDPEDLVSARVSCWDYLHAVGKNQADTSTRELRLGRAVLCVLWPDGTEEEASDTAEWFAIMMEPPPRE